MSTQQRSLRWMLLIGIAVAAVLAATLTVTATRYFLHAEAGELLDAQLARAARLFDAARSAIDSAPGTVLQLPDLGTTIGHEVAWPDGHAYELHVALQIFDARGQLLMRSANAPDTPIAPLDSGFHDSPDGWRVFVLTSRVDGARIVVAEDDRARHELRVGFSAVALLITLGGFALLLAVLLVQVDRGLAPVRRLAARLARREQGDFSDVPGTGLPSEIGPLVEALNHYLGRLRLAFRAEQEFATRAAHELRTPLAAIRIHTENALDADSDSERTESLLRLREGIDRAGRLTSQLLLLTRLEKVELKEQFATLNVRRLLERSASSQEPIAHARGQWIRVDAPPDLNIRGDEDLLLTALDTLITNAIQHGGGEGITLRASATNTHVTIAVIDCGAGLDKARLESLRDSLRDTDADRRPGLGLEIANWIARAHGGQVLLEHGADGVGLVASVRLPLAR
ncbi:MAG: histidine kinase dimerization/phospho-acceptor domain-containing protein [Wenzhouxiangellaceae bacterium]|nr:histidine kinase dimerization/phospho-acceptor domain-containing protein [Wenzhouxiangellaceae bacterium]